MTRFLSFAAVLAFALPAIAAEPAEKLPDGAKVARLAVHPAKVELAGPFAYSQLLVTAHLENGDALDATRIAKVTAPKCVTLSPAGQVRPAADGSGKLTISLAGKSVEVPVTVAGQQTTPTVSFVRDVEPAMSKMGCNAGTCHGAAQGKAGFKLSLRGYDPLFDHRSLTDDLEGRRFNRAAPERSLMLMKPAGAVPHVGGVVCSPGEPYYELLKTWIGDGVKLDLSTSRVAAIQVIPNEVTAPLPGMKQQFAVIATYPDGSKRDVSAEAFIESSNTEVATVDKGGQMTAVRRGETTMLARYEGAYAASKVVVMGDRSGFAWAAPPQLNWVDGLVDAKLKKMKILPSGLCDDDDFVRRVHIDLTGLPPTVEEVRKFLADARPTKVKRDELIDRLIGSDAFVVYWTNKWADMLQVNRKFLGEPGRSAARLDQEGRRHEHALRQIRPRGADRVGVHHRQPAGVVLQGAADAGRGDGEHDAVVPGDPVQLQQVPRPPVRAVDPGPVLRVVGVLRASGPPGGPEIQGPEARRHRGREAAAAGGSHRGRQDRRVQARAHRTRRGGEVPVHPRRPAGQEPAAAAPGGGVDHVQGEPVLRQELRQPHLELPARGRHHRAGGRHPGRQPADQPRTARPADQGVRRQ